MTTLYAFDQIQWCTNTAKIKKGNHLQYGRNTVCLLCRMTISASLASDPINPQ